MDKKRAGVWLSTLTGLVGISLIFFAWCPWVSESYAQQKAVQAFAESWRNSTDGCYIDCEQCGAKETNKVFFGRKVKIVYSCGWEGDVGPLTKTRDVYVSFIGNADYKH